MASSGRRGRKVRGKTVNLNDFLADSNDAPQAGYAVATTTKPGLDWAAEMESQQLDDKYTLDGAYTSSDKFVLPTMPRAVRESTINSNSIPSKPPFTAFLANLPFDIDQDDILKFFNKIKVKSVRLPRDGDSNRHKGFGYADFEDRESLADALSMNDAVMKTRKIRIHVAENQETDRDNRDRKDDRNDRTVGDWRSAPREEMSRDDKSRNGFERYPERSDRYSQDRDRQSGDRGYSNRGFDRNSGPTSEREERGRSSERSYSGGMDRDRGGGFDRYDRSGYREKDRYDSYDRGFDRGSRNTSRRDYGDFRDREWGHNERRDVQRDDYNARSSRNFNRGSSYEREPEKETPRERQKLVLKPRSVPLDARKEESVVSNTSIFGGAKPVDTAARERQIEERLQQEKENKFSSTREYEIERRSRDERWDRRDDKSEDSHDSESQRRDDFEDTERNKKSNVAGGSGNYPRSSPRSSSSAFNLATRPESERSGTSQSEPEDEKSFPSGKPPSPRKEDNRAIPAPPPKENAWQKRNVQEVEKENRYYNTVPRVKRSSSISSNTSSGEKESSRRPSFDRPPSGRRIEDNKRREDSHGRRSDESYVRDDSTSRRRDNSDKSGSASGRSGLNQGRSRGEKSWHRRDNASYYSRGSNDQTEERRAPEMPKYEEAKTPVYASNNKFSLLNNDDDIERGSGSD